jgi:AcrR family transcriptional regulator
LDLIMNIDPVGTTPGAAQAPTASSTIQHNPGAQELHPAGGQAPIVSILHRLPEELLLRSLQFSQAIGGPLGTTALKLSGKFLFNFTQDSALGPRHTFQKRIGTLAADCLRQCVNHIRELKSHTMLALISWVLPARKEDFFSRVITETVGHDKQVFITDCTDRLADLNETDRSHLVAAVLHEDDGPNKAAMLDALGSKLDLLSEDDRTLLVNAMIGAPNAYFKAAAIAALGAGLEHLKEHHESLVTATIGLTDDPLRQATAIAGLGAGFAHLSFPQHGLLIKAATDLADERHKATALAGLAAGLAPPLSRIHRAALVKAVTVHWADRRDDRREKARAIAAMAAGMVHLSEPECKSLVKAALDLPISFWTAPTIGAFGPQLKHLKYPERESLVKAAIGLADPGYKATAIAGLGAGLEHLNHDPECKSLVKAAIGLDRRYQGQAIIGLLVGRAHLLAIQVNSLFEAAVKTALSWPHAEAKARAIAALGPELPHLKDHHASLVAAVTDFWDERLIAEVIVGLATGWADLTSDHRNSLIVAVKNLTDEEQKTRGIAALGAALAQLSDKPDDIATDWLVEAAVGRKNAETGLRVPGTGLTDEDHMAEAIAGLGAGAVKLRDDQLDWLIATALNLTDEAHRATAIAGLGANWYRLSDDQRDTLIAAVIGLPHAQTGLRIPETGLTSETAKATAITGLGQGWWADLSIRQRQMLPLEIAAWTSPQSAEPKSQVLAAIITEESNLLTWGADAAPAATS